MPSSIIVLLVEDEPLIRMEIADDLNDRGFEVIEAGNAHDAILILESRSDVQVLFTDIDMPGRMNGLMLAAHTHAQWPLVKIIVTSGLRSVSINDMPPKSRFMGKPYVPNSIAAAMVDIIG